MLPVIRNKGHRKSYLTKYNRHLMILAIAEMILQGKLRSDIVDTIHTEYGYAIETCKDLITEAQNYAAKVFTEEEKKLKLRQISQLYEDIMYSQEEVSFAKLKAADQYSKLLKFYNPEIAIQNVTNVNFDKLDTQTLEQIGKIIEDKISE